MLSYNLWLKSWGKKFQSYKPTSLFAKGLNFSNPSNIHNFLTITATNKAKDLHVDLDCAPEPLKITQWGAHVKDHLSYTNAEIVTLLKIVEQCLLVGAQEWEYAETEFTFTHFRPLQDIIRLPKRFNFLVKKMNPTGNPTCPPFVWHDKKIFNAFVD